MIDIERLVADHLRAEDLRVVNEPPDRTETAWVQVTQLDAPADRQEHLVEYLLQLDCYAGKDGGPPEAASLARTVRAALHVLSETDFDGAVVTSVRFAGMARIPDTEMKPMRQRWIITARIWAHER